jgi:hypothetical protein
MNNVTEKVYQMMYYLNNESCAGVYDEDEIAMLLTHVDVANSFKFIGSDTDVWKDEEFRHRVCDKSLLLIKQRGKNEKDRIVKEIEDIF